MRFAKQREEAKTIEYRETRFEHAMMHFQKYNAHAKIMYKINISDAARVWNTFQGGIKEELEFHYREIQYNGNSNSIMQRQISIYFACILRNGRGCAISDCIAVTACAD